MEISNIKIKFKKFKYPHCSATKSCLTLCDPKGLHFRPPCPSPSPGVCPSSHPLNQQCYPTISSSVVPFSSYPQSLPASGSFPMSQLFVSGGQSIGVSASASVLPVNSQCWFPLGLTGLISLLSQEFSRVFLVESFMIWWPLVFITGNSSRPSITLLVNSAQVIAVMSAHFFLFHFSKKLWCVLIYMQRKWWPDLAAGVGDWNSNVDDGISRAQILCPNI